MPIDSSIYFNQTPLDVAGSVQKGFALSDAIYNRNKQRKADESEQRVKDAYSKLKVGANGQLSIDPTAVQDLASQGLGKEALSLQSGIQDQQKAQQEALAKKQQSDSIYTFQLLDPSKYQGKPPEQQQMQWLADKQQAIKDGHQEAAQLPDQYDPNLHSQLLDHAKRVGLDLNQYVTDQRSRQTHEDSRASTAATREATAANKQVTELDKIGQRLEQMRGSPAAAQAEKDIYAAQKVNSLVDLYGDPSKLNPQQVQLVATEVAKIASGGVPSIHELQGLNPSTLPKSLAEISQKFVNEPVPANQGAFVKAMKDYTDSLTKDAKAVIKDRYGRILKPYESLYGKHPVYKGFQNEYMNRFNEGSHPVDNMTDDEVKAAYDKLQKANSNANN